MLEGRGCIFPNRGQMVNHIHYCHTVKTLLEPQSEAKIADKIVTLTALNINIQSPHSSPYISSGTGEEKLFSDRSHFIFVQHFLYSLDLNV